MARRMRNRVRTGGVWRPGVWWAFASVVGALTPDVEGSDFDVWDLTTAIEGSVSPGILWEHTLRRTRGSWLAVLADPSPAPAGIRKVGLGLAVAPEAIGAQIPLPLSQGGWDGWLEHRVVHFITPAPAGAINQTNSEALLIDSKAQRRQEDDHLFLVVEVDSDSGETETFEYSVWLRLLFSESPKV